MTLVQKLFRLKRKVSELIRKPIVFKIAQVSYHAYNVTRIVRNPFVILEYVSVFNVLKLIGDRSE